MTVLTLLRAATGRQGGLKQRHLGLRMADRQVQAVLSQLLAAA